MMLSHLEHPKSTRPLAMIELVTTDMEWNKKARRMAEGSKSVGATFEFIDDLYPSSPSLAIVGDKRLMHDLISTLSFPIQVQDLSHVHDEASATENLCAYLITPYSTNQDKAISDLNRQIHAVNDMLHRVTRMMVDRNDDEDEKMELPVRSIHAYLII